MSSAMVYGLLPVFLVKCCNTGLEWKELQRRRTLPCGFASGAASDWLGCRKPLVLLGYATLVGANAILASAQSLELTAVGAALWELQLAMTQGLLAASIADAAPEHLRGTAFQTYDVVLGLAALAASTAAGLLWTMGERIFIYSVGAGTAVIAHYFFSEPKAARLGVNE